MSKKKEDLGIVIKPKKQILWEKVKKEAEILIENHEESLAIQKEILKLAENIISEESARK